MHGCASLLGITVSLPVLLARCSLDSETRPYGSYEWPADTPLEMSIERNCQHSCGSLSGGKAVRRCGGRGEWEETDFTDCPTLRYCEIFNIISTVSCHRYCTAA